MQRWKVMPRAAQALLLFAGATVALGEGSDTYDASRHVAYATRQLRLRRQRARHATEAGDGAAARLWLQRETPTFPYVVAVSPADNPARIDALLGVNECVVGSPLEPTSASLDALVVPVAAPLDALVQRGAQQWRACKRMLRGGGPAAFDDALAQRLAVLLEALRASASATETPASTANEDDEPGDQQPSEAATTTTTDDDRGTMVFYLRDFDAWDDAAVSAWFQWVHDVTRASLAHVVLATQAPLTMTAMRAWQRAYNVRDATDFVAILLRAATRACDASDAQDKLVLLSAQLALGLRGLEKQATDEHDDDAIGFEPPRPPAEAQLIIETVGNWWRDLETVCRALQVRGLSTLASDDERRVLVQQVCDEYEREAMLHVLATLGIYATTDDQYPTDERRDARISALQAWKCLEVVTQVGGDAQLVASPQKLLQRDTSKPLNCAHPVEALLPFNQRVHGEAKFLELLDQGILYLRPKNDVEIGVLPCDAKSLVAPCWVETRPLIKRAFEKLWRDDAHYQKVLELERFEDNYKLSEEVTLYEHEINERRKVLDAQTREFLMLQPAMKKHEVAQRRAELALIELEIQSKLVYLERLHGLLD